MKEMITFKKLRVVWVNCSPLDVFLHNVALLNILKHFNDLGHKATLITARSKNASVTKNLQNMIVFIPLRFVTLISALMFAIVLFFYLPIYMLISKPEYVLLAPGISVIGSFPGLLISKLKKTNFILDIRSIPVETVGVHGFITNFLFSLSVKIAKKSFDGITILTHSMKKEVCNNYVIDPTKVGVWTSGVSDVLFDPQNCSSEALELRTKLGLSEKFIVFYHGIFTATRGLIETIESIKIIRQKYPDVVFFMLGTGPLVSKLRTLVQEEGLRKNVIVHNPVDQSEVPKFIKMCDVGIVPLPNNPYWRAQSPLKLLEYLAMEKAVILTDIPAHVDIVGEAKCGVYISSVDPMEIANAIENVYLNKDSLVGWGKLGRHIIKKQYTWEKVAKSLENFLQTIN